MMSSAVGNDSKDTEETRYFYSLWVASALGQLSVPVQPNLT